MKLSHDVDTLILEPHDVLEGIGEPKVVTDFCHMAEVAAKVAHRSRMGVVYRGRDGKTTKIGLR